MKGCLRRLMAMRHIRFYPQCKVKAGFDVLRVAKCEVRAFICLEPAPSPSCQLQHGGQWYLCITYLTLDGLISVQCILWHVWQVCQKSNCITIILFATIFPPFPAFPHFPYIPPLNCYKQELIKLWLHEILLPTQFMNLKNTYTQSGHNLDLHSLR